MHPADIHSVIALPSGGRQQILPAKVVTSVAGDRDWKDAALQKPLNFAAKRLLDICVSATALIVLLPFLLAIAAAIKWESAGPIFFMQDRWGRSGRLIRIFKFRSMRTDACDASGVAQTRPNDPRVTRIGAFLRKTNLDELPQLINILLGDMSLVGPRCHVPGMLAAGMLYEELVKDYHIRHLVRPGLTGLAQLRGYRGPTDREDLARARFDSDVEYIRSFNIWMDIKILVGTLVKEVRGGTGF
ncbi:MAG: sugar transferase [Rhizobiaceae bacterium]|nr:sugar transferase [Rhizobiaceae bacterium]